MYNDKIANLLALWKEARTAVNLLESRLTDLRLKGLTLVAALTSLAITLYRFVPASLIQMPSPISLRPCAFIEIIVIVAIVILTWQDRVYHRWLYGAVANALEIEDRIYKEIKLEDCEKTRFMLTYSISGRRFESPPTSYWRTMMKSPPFWIGIGIYASVLIASLVLFYTLQFL